MPISSNFSLLKTKRFLPLFITQFLGAFNDNVFKNALVILLTYKVMTLNPTYAGIFVTLAGAVFILPFFLFSATSGQIADKFEKTRLISSVKFAEIIFMLIGCVGFFYSNLFLLFTTLFLMGLHSTFFGPLKYAILPEHLPANELLNGNSLIEAGTFIAILVGTLLGSILIIMTNNKLAISSVLLIVAITGWMASLYIPKSQPANPTLKINFNFIKATSDIIKNTRKEYHIFHCILGISWFWLIGATFLTQLPSFVKNVLYADPYVVTLFLIIFSIGIAFGSLLSNTLLKTEISARYVPASILSMSVFMIDLYFVSSAVSVTQPTMTIFDFLSKLNSWHIMLDMLLLAICGGIYAVPLYAIIQTHAKLQHRAQTIACNNIINAFFMVVAAIACTVLIKINFSIADIFLILGIVNLFVALFICCLLPDALLKTFLKQTLKFFYRVKVIGIENYYAAGNRTMIVANHTSFLDVPLLLAFLPDTLLFAINTYIAKTKWLRPFLSLVKVFEIDPTNAMSTKDLIKAIKQEKKCVIFPEGRLTTTGGLMKIYPGTGLVADHTDAVILPIHISGTEYTSFSRLKDKFTRHWFPKITLTILPPTQLNINKNLKGEQRRQAIDLKLYSIMTNMIFASNNHEITLFESLIEARKKHQGKRNIIEDINWTPINYNELITRSFILGERINASTRPNEIIGILLPNIIATAVTFFAIQAYGRIAAMLNFSAGINNLISACETANIKTIYTSHKFVDSANLIETITQLKAKHITIIYLEDLRNEISLREKLAGLFKSKFADYYYHQTHLIRNPHEPAVILFTSGSECTPKGVVLSHANIQANRLQISARLDLNEQDILFNALPLFHSFGLTAGLLLPLLSGLKTFLYPSPLHYRLVPEMIYESNATLTFGTDTFLYSYGRYANSFDFHKMRYVYAGAEKLKDLTRKLWMDKFGIRILEGYGVTETAPAISLNTPLHNKFGTVGRLLPGMEYKLESVPGINEGGRLWIKGPNIMLGYLVAEKPGKLISPTEGWHDTGDIVTVDEQGFITIKDRAKRFAKIAGEMISLTAVENKIAMLWPEQHHAMLSIPDEHRGEKLILVTENKQATREELIEYFKKEGMNELSLPKIIIHISEIPLLGSGKIDYVSTKNWFLSTTIKQH